MDRIKELSPQETEWYEKLKRRFPGQRERNLRKDARRLAAGKPAFMLAARPERPARPAELSTEGLPDTAAYWAAVKGLAYMVPAKPGRPARPEIKPEELV